MESENGATRESLEVDEAADPRWREFDSWQPRVRPSWTVAATTAGTAMVLQCAADLYAFSWGLARTESALRSLRLTRGVNVLIVWLARAAAERGASRVECGRALLRAMRRFARHAVEPQFAEALTFADELLSSPPADPQRAIRDRFAGSHDKGARDDVGRGTRSLLGIASSPNFDPDMDVEVYEEEIGDLAAALAVALGDARHIHLPELAPAFAQELGITGAA